MRQLSPDGTLSVYCPHSGPVHAYGALGESFGRGRRWGTRHPEYVMRAPLYPPPEADRQMSQRLPAIHHHHQGGILLPPPPPPVHDAGRPPSPPPRPQPPPPTAAARAPASSCCGLAAIAAAAVWMGVACGVAAGSYVAFQSKSLEVEQLRREPRVYRAEMEEEPVRRRRRWRHEEDDDEETEASSLRRRFDAAYSTLLGGWTAATLRRAPRRLADGIRRRCRAFRPSNDTAAAVTLSVLSDSGTAASAWGMHVAAAAAAGAAAPHRTLQYGHGGGHRVAVFDSSDDDDAAALRMLRAAAPTPASAALLEEACAAAADAGASSSMCRRGWGIVASRAAVLLATRYSVVGVSTRMQETHAASRCRLRWLRSGVAAAAAAGVASSQTPPAAAQRQRSATRGFHREAAADLMHAVSAILDADVQCCRSVLDT
eukprot:TRINITY_DN20309_c0_g1_i1.p1 TRINITY_DN20309_c0_g1~~TRINITY_DN20309_c0_g1_i1.p1  ORF type:complete len:429 (+),score=133.68 TRINITY_DN20309_c0_g1_i1:140-1426(+)